ncbi:MAG: urease accessory protein UreF [Thermicanus sp.]|nr:urease accessory protein UreF [Thermicanus sp.]
MPLSLLHLLQISDSQWPIGGFSHSFGLETYIQEGYVYDAESLKNWVLSYLLYSVAPIEGIAVSWAWEASKAHDVDSFLALNERLTAIKLPREGREASLKMGNRFAVMAAKTFAIAYPWGEMPVHTAPMFGWTAYLLGVEKEETLLGFFFSQSAIMVNNGVRAIPLGQLEGQRILHMVKTRINQLVRQVTDGEISFGNSSPFYDIMAMKHEQLYSRLFMS